MYELTLILSLMLGGNQTTAELDVNTQFASMEQCKTEGNALAKTLKASNLETIQVQCELD